MINPNAERINGETEIRCKWCNSFTAVKRIDAFFCDDHCKNLYHSDQRRRKRVIKNAQLAVSKLCNGLPVIGDSPEFAALEALKRRIENALYNVEN